MTGSERLDPTCNPPFSRDTAFPWSREPATLAKEIAASVLRRLDPDWHRLFAQPNSCRGTFGSDLRDALDRELTAALRRDAAPALSPSPDPSPQGGGEARAA